MDPVSPPHQPPLLRYCYWAAACIHTPAVTPFASFHLVAPFYRARLRNWDATYLETPDFLDDVQTYSAKLFVSMHPVDPIFGCSRVISHQQTNIPNPRTGRSFDHPTVRQVAQLQKGRCRRIYRNVRYVEAGEPPITENYWRRVAFTSCPGPF